MKEQGFSPYLMAASPPAWFPPLGGHKGHPTNSDGPSAGCDSFRYIAPPFLFLALLKALSGDNQATEASAALRWPQRAIVGLRRHLLSLPLLLSLFLFLSFPLPPSVYRFLPPNHSSSPSVWLGMGCAGQFGPVRNFLL